MLKKRLKLNLSQKTLSEKSGVSYGTLKDLSKKTISLESCSDALALGRWGDLNTFFSKMDNQLPASLDEYPRKRGRR